MSGTRITQLYTRGFPGRRYGSFAGRGAAPSPTLVSLNELLRSRRSTQSHFLTFISDFQAYIDAWSSLSTTTKEYLNLTDFDIGGTLGNIHLLLWLDAVLIANLGEQTRLPWSGYDPLGLMSLSEYVVLIDPADTGAGTLTDDGINNTITVPGVGVQALWDGQHKYTYKRWKKTGNESGNTARRLLTYNGEETFWLHRGGDHEQAGEVMWSRNDVAKPHTPCHYMGYPGELATKYYCNGMITSGGNAGKWNNKAVVDNSREDFKRWIIKQVGYVGSVGNRVFATGGIWTDGNGTGDLSSNTAARSGAQFIEYRDCRGISDTMPGADSHEEFIDSQHGNRFPSINTGSQLYCYTASADDCYIRDSVFECATDDFPYLPSTDPDSQGHGDNIRIDQGHRFSIKRAKFKGVAPHFQVSIYNAYDCHVEGNQIANRAHVALGVNFLSGHGASAPTPDYTIIYNRVGPYNTMADHSGGGIQIGGGSRGVRYGNVLFTDDPIEGHPVWSDSCYTNNSQDAPAIDNEGHHNFSWNGACYRGHASSYQGNSNSTYTGNANHHNLYHSRSDANTGSIDATLVYNAGAMVANDGFGNTETDSLFVFGNAAAAMSIWKAGGYDTYGVEDVGTWFVRNSLTTANLLLLNDPDNYDFSHPTNSPLAELFGEHHDLMPWTPMGSDFSVRRPLVALCQPLQYQIDRVLSYPSRVSGRVVSPPSRPSGRVKCYSLRSSGRVYVE